jgi:heme-degrading monooxygenase HmoA
MIISITSSRATREQTAPLNGFLESFLPKMRQFPGVKAIYYFARPDREDASTLVIWESEAALKQYRESELFKQALAFEQKNNLPGTREAYPLIFAF